MATTKRKPHALYCDDPSRTKQAMADECDINKIIQRVQQGGDLSHINTRAAQFGDFSNVPDYRESLDFINNANALFMALDATIRDRFANDPAKLLDFLQNPNNKAEATRLGLLKPQETPTASPTIDPTAGSQPTPVKKSGANKGEPKGEPE